MKKRTKVIILVCVLTAVFAAITVFSFMQSVSVLRDGFLASEGTAAKNFAVLTAESIKLSDADVERLKGYSYAQLQASDENKALSALMSNDSLSGKVDYAYVLMHLKGDDVKYTLDETNAEAFGAPAGTKLDIMWLLDVNVADGTDEAAVADAGSELSRYSYYIDDDALILGERPCYIYNASAWGDHICGYAPLYSTDGTYIGAVGVDLKTGDFEQYLERGLLAMAVPLIIAVLCLAIVFIVIYLNYRRAQLEKIYTDALTKINNRSYYNNVFIRRMNNMHKREKYFALMIADIDFFKKVNDTFGHEVGDAVLIEMAQLLADTFGKEHVCRFGGEEFVVGMWLNDEAEAAKLLDGLFAKINERLFSEQQINVTLSLGCCTYEADKLNGWLISGMLRAADCTLYKVKENGRKAYRTVHFDPEVTYTK